MAGTTILAPCCRMVLRWGCCRSVSVCLPTSSRLHWTTFPVHSWMPVKKLLRMLESTLRETKKTVRPWNTGGQDQKISFLLGPGLLVGANHNIFILGSPCSCIWSSQILVRWTITFYLNYSQKTKSSLISCFCSRAYGESIFQMSSLLSTPHTKCIIWVNLRN